MKWTAPVNIRLVGDKYAAGNMIGAARKELGILQNAMSFQGLKQLSRAVRFPDGSTIDAKIINGKAFVTLVVPPAPHKTVIDEKRFYEQDIPLEKSNIPEVRDTQQPALGPAEVEPHEVIEPVKPEDIPEEAAEPIPDELKKDHRVLAPREWFLSRPGSGFAVVVSTRSGNEAFAWDIFTDTVLVEKQRLFDVKRDLDEMGFSSDLEEALPSAYIDDVWVRELDNLYTYTGQLNQPMFFCQLLSPDDDGFTEDSFYWPYDSYYSGGKQHIEWRHHYINPPEGFESHGVRSPMVIYVSKYDYPTTELYEYLFLNSLFGYDLTGIQASRQNLEEVSEFVRNMVTPYTPEDEVPPRNCWLSSGIATRGQASIAFEYVGLCLVTDEEERVSCIDMDENYENRIFRLYVRPDSEICGVGQQILDLVNQERETVGYDPLYYNRNLQIAAQRHASDMAINKDLSHTGSDGSDFHERIRDANFLLYHLELTQPNGYGENVARGDMIYHTPEDIVAAWMASPGHAQVILTEKFTCTGLATALADNGDVYVCQTFGFRDQTWPGFAAFDTANMLSYIAANFEYNGGVEDTNGVLRVFLSGGTPEDYLKRHEKVDKGFYVKPHPDFQENEILEHKTTTHTGKDFSYPSKTYTRPIIKED